MSLLRPCRIKPVLANRQKALVQCSNCVIATASHEQDCSCQSPESPCAMFQLCHCYRPRINKTCSCQSPESPRAMFQLCHCYGLRIIKLCSCHSPESPSCNVPIVSLLLPRTNKLVLPIARKPSCKCFNGVIATASHKQACSCESPESPRAKFQLCHCYGLTETSLFLPIARKLSCNVPIVSLLRRRMNNPVLANRQKAVVQCPNCVIPAASQKQTCFCQSPGCPRAMFQVCHCYGLA